MKRLLLGVSFALLSLSVLGQSQKPSPVDYLQQMGMEFEKISNDMMTYVSAASHGKGARKVEKRRNELIQQVKESETAIRRMKPFEGSTALRDSLVAYLRLNYIVLNHDYAKILDMEDIAEQSYDAMEAYMLAKEKAEEKLDGALERFNLQYRDFAATNHITFQEGESDLSKKIEKSNKVGAYANKAYLLFFKSYKNEAYLMDAISKNDINGIEQSRNALATSSAEDLAKAKTLGDFNNDASLRSALQQALQFYQLESGDKLKAQIDLLVAKDNFEKLKKSFDATPASKRTKETVDAYNKSIEDYNKKVALSNNVHAELNKKRSAAYKVWNDAYDNFLDKHTPKHR